MNHDAQTTLQGEVIEIFAHRFVVKTVTGKILADLTPKGAEKIVLRKGDQVTLLGEMKPSELKVHQIKRDHSPTITIEHKKPHPDQHEQVDAKPALRTAAANGFAVVGNPRRKPKHFENSGKRQRRRLRRAACRTRRRAAQNAARRTGRSQMGGRNPEPFLSIRRWALDPEPKRWRDNQVRTRAAAAASGPSSR